MPPRLLPAALIALALPGCSALQSYLGSNHPTASVVGTHVNSLSLDNAGLAFDIKINNPYAVPLPLANVGYTLASGGSAFLKGQAGLQGTVPANGSSTVTVPATVNFQDLFAAVKGVSPGQVIPYHAAMNLSVNAPAVGPMSLPVEKSGELPVPAAPDVQLTNIDWAHTGLDGAAGTLHLKVTNTNQFPVDLSKLALALSLGGSQVARTSVASAGHFGPHAANNIDVPVSLSTQSLGTGALNLLRGRGAAYNLAGGLEGNTTFGPLNLPFQNAGRTTFNK